MKNWSVTKKFNMLMLGISILSMTGIFAIQCFAK